MSWPDIQAMADAVRQQRTPGMLYADRVAAELNQFQAREAATRGVTMPCNQHDPLNTGAAGTTDKAESQLFRCLNEMDGQLSYTGELIERLEAALAHVLAPPMAQTAADGGGQQTTRAMDTPLNEALLNRCERQARQNLAMSNLLARIRL